MKSVLKVFMAEDCANCVEAHAIAADIAQAYPNLVVEVIDIAHNPAQVPEVVFATPTFMFNNRIVSLGNPTLDEVAGWVSETTTHST